MESAQTSLAARASAAREVPVKGKGEPGKGLQGRLGI